MTICNNRQCPLRGIEQDSAQFIGRKGICKQCATCRARELERKAAAAGYVSHRSRRSTGGVMATRGIVDTLIPGAPPQFLSQAHQQVHRGWLLSLINGGSDMNKTQTSIMQYLQRRGPGTALDLCRAAGVSLTAVNVALESLLALGYVERCAIGHGGGVRVKENDYAATG